jgi:hypothetical protein
VLTFREMFFLIFPPFFGSCAGEGQWHRCKVDTPPGLTAAPHLAASARESPADVVSPSVLVCVLY